MSIVDVDYLILIEYCNDNLIATFNIIICRWSGRAKNALERFGGLFIKVSDMKMKTTISRQGKAQRLDFVPFEQCFLRRHSRRKTNVFLKSPHLNLARKDFKEANWVILSQLIPYQLRAHNSIWVEVLLTF